MAPEVLARAAYDDRADIWSAGVLLYALLAHTTIGVQAEHVLAAGPAWVLPPLPEGTSPCLAGLLRCLLVPDQSLRPQSHAVVQMDAFVAAKDLAATTILELPPHVMLAPAATSPPGGLALDMPIPAGEAGLRSSSPQGAISACFSPCKPSLDSAFHLDHVVLVIHFVPLQVGEDLLPSIESSIDGAPVINSGAPSAVRFGDRIELSLHTWGDAEIAIQKWKPCILHLCSLASAGVTARHVTGFLRSCNNHMQHVPDGVVFHGLGQGSSLQELVIDSGLSWTATAPVVSSQSLAARSFCTAFYRRLVQTDDVNAAWEAVVADRIALHCTFVCHDGQRPGGPPRNFFFGSFHPGGTFLSAMTQFFVIPFDELLHVLGGTAMLLWLGLVVFQMISAHSMQHGGQVRNYRSVGFLSLHLPALAQVAKHVLWGDASGIVLAAVIIALVVIRNGITRLAFSRVTSAEQLHPCHGKRYDPVARVRIAVEVAYSFVMLSCVALAHPRPSLLVYALAVSMSFAYVLRLAFFLGLLWEEVDAARLQRRLGSDLANLLCWVPWVMRSTSGGG